MSPIYITSTYICVREDKFHSSFSGRIVIWLLDKSLQKNPIIIKQIAKGIINKAYERLTFSCQHSNRILIESHILTDSSTVLSPQRYSPEVSRAGYQTNLWKLDIAIIRRIRLQLNHTMSDNLLLNNCLQKRLYDVNLLVCQFGGLSVMYNRKLNHWCLMLQYSRIWFILTLIFLNLLLTDYPAKLDWKIHY